MGALVGCAGGRADDAMVSAYLDDAGFRRKLLVAALVNPGNLYARERLFHYASGDGADWDRLPEWNPPAEPVTAADLDASGGASSNRLSAAAAPLSLPAPPTSDDDPALLALGQQAFRRYPTQVAPYFAVALASRTAARRYGLWVTAQEGVGGLVRARMGDGTVALAMTCSTCHSAAADGDAVVPGLPNRDLDLGRALLDASGTPSTAQDPLAVWGPGRLDVTTTSGIEPVRIPDLRPVRWLSFLHHDATLRGCDLATLALRIETLIITANSGAVRPSRIIALALAAYVRSLAVGLPSTEAAQRRSPHGVEVFAATCARCHTPPALTGDPVPLATIGTDPTLGLSPERGTGAYRVPSLHGVGTRGPLLHDGTLPSVDALLDPARLADGFARRLHGTGAVAGHLYGLDLSAPDRQALIDYLREL